MASRDLIIDFSEYDVNHVVADLEEIRRYNLQRFEMEQLTAIVHIDHDNKICVGYKDIGHDEFWIRGHMPQLALMPGVMMCDRPRGRVCLRPTRFDPCSPQRVDRFRHISLPVAIHLRLERR